jgi:hypothetical protein|tara:strand:+ start:359 stop:499 length:141 start_codon:yes stop_codon:yes gene_type:complete
MAINRNSDLLEVLYLRKRCIDTPLLYRGTLNRGYMTGFLRIGGKNG